MGNCQYTAMRCVPETKWVTQPQNVLPEAYYDIYAIPGLYSFNGTIDQSQLCIPNDLTTEQEQNNYCASACAYVRSTEGLDMTYAMVQKNEVFYNPDGSFDYSYPIEDEENEMYLCNCFYDTRLREFEPMVDISDGYGRIISVPEECKQYGDQKNYYNEETCDDDNLGSDHGIPNHFKKDYEKWSKLENRYSKYQKNEKYAASFEKLKKENEEKIEEKINICSHDNTYKEYMRLSKKLEKKSRNKELKQNKNRKQQLKKNKN